MSLTHDSYRATLAVVALLFAPAICSAQTYTISTIAGNGTNGFSGDSGAASAAQLASPASLAIDKSGNLYIADQGNQRIRLLQGGTITTSVGTGLAGYGGDGKAASSALLNSPNGLALDSSGNLYIADTANAVVRKVTSGTISTIAGNNNFGTGFAGDGGAATSATLNQPLSVAVDSSGNVYIADFANNRIRKVSSSGTISAFAGTGGIGFVGDGGRATSALLFACRGLAVDASGSVYIADSGNHRVRKVTPDGIITTVAGNGIAGFSGDLGLAVNASLNSPRGVAVDAAGNLYIADYSNGRIRKVSTNGSITTIAGNGKFAYAGDGGPATSASLLFPLAVAVDASGKVYVADTGNNVVRQLTPDAGTNARPAIAAVISAGGFGGATAVSPGSWVEIYGTGLGIRARQWAASDFTGVAAPTLLDGTRVTVAGQPAAISYISDNQVNAQIPSNVGTGSQQVIVSTFNGVSDPKAVTVNAVQPGLYAPPVFNIGGKQYVAAVFLDGVTFVLPTGAVAGITSRPAKPGETITMYGMGFGTVTPDIAAGQLVKVSNTIVAPMQITFGTAGAKLLYNGLAPDATGLYQFNMVVPAVAASDATPLSFTLGGVAGSQTLYTAIGN